MIRRIVPIAMLAALPAAAQDLTFTAFHENGTYDLGEKAGWKARRPPGDEAPYHYVIRKNNFDTLQAGTLAFSRGDARIEIALGEPAMITSR
jgi:hypothetical protein